MSLHSPGDTRSFRRLRRWTIALITAMSLSMAATLVTEWRQVDTLRNSLPYRSDYTVWGFFQAEHQAATLRQMLQVRLLSERRDGALRPADPGLIPVPTDQQLRMAFELMVSRIDIIRPERAPTGLRVHEEQARTVAELDAFVAQFDPWLSLASPVELPSAVLAEALQELVALRGPLRDLSVGIQHSYAEVLTARGEAVDKRMVSLVLLAALLLATVVSSAALLALQMRAVGSRQSRLLQALRRLRVAQHRANRASDAKTRFLANMSHEIRTPLQGIVGQLSLLQDEVRPETRADHVRVAQDSAQQLLDLLNDILDVSRIESGGMRIVPGACRPAMLATDLVHLMRPAAEARNLTLRASCADDVPALISADVARVRQVLLNLLSNAVKFTDRGVVRLTVTVRSFPFGRRLCFEVEDTGIGMDEAMLAKVFHRFHQGDDSLRRRYGGSGLGLEISRGLARLMGGDVTARSRPGRGSQFLFTLPLTAPPVGEDNPRSLPSVPAGLMDLSAALRSAARAADQAAAVPPWPALAEAPVPGGAAGAAGAASELAAAAAGTPPLAPPGGAQATTPRLAAQALRPSPGHDLAPGRGETDASPRQAVASPSRPEAAAVSGAAAAAVVPAPPPVVVPRGLHILVADDNAMNRRFVAHVLARLGCQAVFAENGEQAVALFASAAFDAVLMDVHMPGLDGLAATRRIRACGPHGQRVPIVALTADAMRETAERAASAGVTAMLYKPMRKEDLIHVLSALPYAARPTPTPTPTHQVQAQAQGTAGQTAPAVAQPGFSDVTQPMPLDAAPDLALELPQPTRETATVTG